MSEGLDALAYAAAYEEAAREAARRSTLAFTRYTKPDYEAERVHKLIADALDEAAAVPGSRIMIEAPPRGGKSELATRRFPARFIGARPNAQIITASGSAELAKSFGRDVRNIVSSPEYSRVFPGVKIAPDSAAKGVWATTAGGVYISASIDSRNTIGRGADLLIIDDAFAQRADVTKLRRAQVWEWFQSVAYLRMMPGGSIVIVNTRWHEADLCGTLLEKMKEGGEKWKVVRIQGIWDGDGGEWGDPLGREIGESFAPKRWPLDELELKKEVIGPLEWASQFQQKPVPAEGAIFSPDAIGVVPDMISDGVTWVRSWDLAATAQVGSKDPDWTVGALVGRTPLGRTIIGGLERFRGPPEEVERRIMAVAESDGAGVPIELPQDPGAAGKAYAQYLVRLLPRHQVTARAVSGSKETRAAAFASQVNSGNVLMVAARWNEAVTLELASFPYGAHDDIVDALASGYNALAGGASKVARVLPFNFMAR